MNKRFLTVTLTALLLGVFGVREARAGSCVNPGYFVTHFEECAEEFAECFEGYADFWDAILHTDDIVECIVEYIEAETEEAVATAVMIITNDNEDVEEAVASVLEAVFGVDDIIFDTLDAGQGGFREAKEDLKDLIQGIIENRKDAREKLKEYIKKLIEARNEARQKIKGKLKEASGKKARLTVDASNAQPHLFPASSDNSSEDAVFEFDLRYGDDDHWYGQ